jgi:translation initiation factor 2B subunit (eIF-2B alpha/beta/delta family)
LTTESEQLIKDIEDMKVKGAYLITKVALEALGLRAHELAAQGEAPAPALRAASSRLVASQPSMACVANGCGYVLGALSDDLPPDQVVEALAQRSQAFLAAFDEAQQRALDVGARLVRDGEAIFIHSYTGTLLETFRRARALGKQFRIFATESRPYCEGRFMVSELLKLGIPCTIVTDASIGSYIGRADKSLVGSDSILVNGNVVNKMGTYLLALACRERGVPLYASGNIFKLSMASLRGDEVRMLRRGDDGAVAIAPQGLPADAPITVENTIFDETPARFFAALITDQGVLPPPAIAEFRNHPMLAVSA